MNDTPTKATGRLRTWWQRLVKNWIGEFDEEMAACELNCRELDCDQERWEHCENRLRYKAELQSHRQKVEQGQSYRDVLDLQQEYQQQQAAKAAQPEHEA